jgi:hypothetical protein
MAGTENDDSTGERRPKRVLIADALALLPYPAPEAATRLTDAIYKNDCRLYCDGKPVPLHSVVQLRVVPRLENDGRWIGAVTAIGMTLGWGPEGHRWEVDEKEIRRQWPPSPTPASSAESIVEPSSPSSIARIVEEDPKNWLRRTKRRYPKQSGEPHKDWAKRMVGHMSKAQAEGRIRNVWTQASMERRLRDKDTEDESVEFQLRRLK